MAKEALHLIKRSPMTTNTNKDLLFGREALVNKTKNNHQRSMQGGLKPLKDKDKTPKESLIGLKIRIILPKNMTKMTKDMTGDTTTVHPPRLLHLREIITEEITIQNAATTIITQKSLPIIIEIGVTVAIGMIRTMTLAMITGDAEKKGMTSL
jgi:hypothetical protein